MLQEFSRKLSGVTLSPGGKGQFEVSLDGAPVFSKTEKGRFPDNKEIRDAIRARSRHRARALTAFSTLPAIRRPTTSIGTPSAAVPAFVR